MLVALFLVKINSPCVNDVTSPPWDAILHKGKKKKNHGSIGIFPN